jgi:hypothetical protein
LKNVLNKHFKKYDLAWHLFAVESHQVVTVQPENFSRQKHSISHEDLACFALGEI